MSKSVCLLILGALSASQMALAATSTATAASTSSATVNSPVQSGTSAVAMDSVKPTAKKWSASVFQETYVKGAAANRGEYSGTIADAFVEVGYKLTDTQKIAIRPNFHMNQTAKTKNTGEYVMGDVALIHSNASLFTLSDTKVASNARLYLPTNENSRENGKIEARFGLAFDQVASPKMTISYGNTVRGYYFTENNDGLNGLRNYLSAKAAYQVTAAIAPYMELMHEARWRHNGKGNGSLEVKPESAKEETAGNADSAYFNLGADISLAPVSLTIYVEQEHDLRASGQDFSLLNEDELTYYAAISASM